MPKEGQNSAAVDIIDHQKLKLTSNGQYAKRVLVVTTVLAPRITAISVSSRRSADVSDYLLRAA